MNPDFYELSNIYTKWEKLYTKGDIFKAYIENKQIFPLEINLKKITQNHIQKDYNGILASIKKLEEQSFSIIYEEKNFKSLGVQKIPSKIYFKSLEDFLVFIKKEDEYKLFVNLYKKITQKQIALKNLFLQKPFMVLEYQGLWDQLLSVVEYLCKDKQTHIYIRELDIEKIDTKFIEKYKKIIDILVSFIKNTKALSSLANNSFEIKYGFKYPQALIRFRILDEDLYISGLSDISLPQKDFQNLNIACKNIFIVENKITTLSFPKLKNSIVIFGQGYGVSALKRLEWLNKKNIFYWGDIDVDGFAIFSQLKGYYPHAKSILMDIKTLERFIDLKVQIKSKSIEKTLLNLNNDERIIYERLVNEYYGEDFRLEQERLPFNYIKENLEKIDK